MKAMLLAMILGVLSQVRDEQETVRRAELPVKAVVRASDFQGAVVKHNNEQVQIIEIQWGINARDQLSAVYSKLLYGDGNVVTTDSRAKAKRVFRSPSDMHGFFMRFGKEAEPRWVERIEFLTDSEGRLAIAGHSALRGNTIVEEHVDLASSYLPKQCKWWPVIRCSNDPLDPCIAGCPSTGACVCSGQGDCDDVGVAECDGECPTPKQCYYDAMNGGCGCH